MGTDGAVLDEQARKIQSEMTATGKFRAVTSNAALDRPEVIIEPDLDRLAELGISTATISETLRIATIGDIDANLAKFTVGDRQIPIRVQLDEAGARRHCRRQRAAGADAVRRHRAAVVGGRRSASGRARPRSPASTASAASSSAPTWRRAPSSARGSATVWAAAGGQEHAGRHAHPGDRRRRGHGRGVRRLRHRHVDRPDAGAGGADPAVRLGVPLLHHPGLAAAGDRRRGGRRCG